MLSQSGRDAMRIVQQEGDERLLVQWTTCKANCRPDHRRNNQRTSRRECSEQRDGCDASTRWRGRKVMAKEETSLSKAPGKAFDDPLSERSPDRTRAVRVLRRRIPTSLDGMRDAARFSILCLTVSDVLFSWLSAGIEDRARGPADSESGSV